MSNHLIARLNIAREDPNIAAAVPRASFRTPQQAARETKLIQAAVLSKALAQNGRLGAMMGGDGGGGSAAAAAGAYAGGTPHSAAPTFHRNGAAGMGSGIGAASPPSSAQVVRRPLLRPTSSPVAAAAPVPIAPPLMPFVYRRAASDIQITDPETGDILQLDAGTWVMTAASPSAAKGTITIYTTDPDDGRVISYEVPLPDGKVAGAFDMHTLNPIETVASAGES
jgi:hypothetical protein